MIIYSGKNVWPLEMNVEGNTFPDLFSLGVSLGRIPRFTGHTRELYTVLPHALTVAAIMPSSYGILGLLHDAPEACCADVPTPWKTDAAKAREHELYERILEGHGLVWPIPEEAQAAVDIADRKALAAEAHVLGHPAAAEVWPEFDEATAELTRYHLQFIGQMMVPEIAGAIYREAFAAHAKFADQSLIADQDLLNAVIAEIEPEE
jgi:hypothetical protein